MDNLQSGWNNFFQQAYGCTLCKDKYRLPVENIFKGTSIGPNDPWGLAWYDKYRNLDSGLMIVGMDFGNEDMVRESRAALKQNPKFEPDRDQDKSYVRLDEFLGDALLQNRAFVTNAALCVRRDSDEISGELTPQVYVNCLPHLRRQINLAKPYIIVPLGNVGFDSVMAALGKQHKREGITKIAGKKLLVNVNQAVVVVVPAIHPSRAQEGWKDARQKKEIYRPLKQLLDNMDVSTGRGKFRELFGTI